IILKINEMKKRLAHIVFGIFFLCESFTINQVLACTRVVYQGPNGTIITARSMDWKGEIPANLWIFPRGMEHNGEVGTTSLKWKSKYGSVI
ncbi:hypothetical protein ACSTKX_24750, partial [Vibrio parahaemolyticus]